MQITHPRRALAIAGLAVTVLVGGAVLTPVGSASAAAAKSVLLGKSNKTATTTTIQNTKGTALSLKSPSNKPPLAVSNSKTVKNLSADKLDGHSSGDFARSTAVTGTIVAINEVAACPKGTTLTGGGGLAYSGLAYSGVAFNDEGNPINAWQVLPVGDDSEVYSLATCYSPSGKPVPGSLEDNGAAQKLTAAQRGFLKLSAAKR